MNDRQARNEVIQRYSFRMAMLDSASYAIRNAVATAIDDNIRDKLAVIEEELDELSEKNAQMLNFMVEEEE